MVGTYLIGSNTFLLVDFASNWDGGVDWVGDDTNNGVWSSTSASTGQVGDNGGVGVEQIVTGHTFIICKRTGQVMSHKYESY